MKQTYTEYVRRTVAAHDGKRNESISICTSVLRGMLEEMDAKEKSVPLTGGMRHLAERIVDNQYGDIWGESDFKKSTEEILSILTDAPEIIALQESIREIDALANALANENRELKETVIHREAVIESLARPSTGEYTATRPNENYTRFREVINARVERDAGLISERHYQETVRSAADELRSMNICPHGANPDTCVTCHAQHGIHHHSGQQRAYDSCHHGNKFGAWCSICEPNALA